MAAGKLDLLIEQGATFRHTLTYLDSDENPINLTDYEANMEIRSTVREEEVLAFLSTSNSKISINGTEGQIVLVIDPSETSTYDWETGVYDLELVSPPGEITRLVYGSVTISPEVTRI